MKKSASARPASPRVQKSPPALLREAARVIKGYRTGKELAGPKPHPLERELREAAEAFPLEVDLMLGKLAGTPRHERKTHVAVVAVYGTTRSTIASALESFAYDIEWERTQLGVVGSGVSHHYSYAYSFLRKYCWISGPPLQQSPVGC